MYVITSVYDAKTEEFNGLHLSRSREAAVRAFSDAVTGGQDLMFSKHPEDFSLHEVGIFEESSGEVMGKDGETTVLVTAEVVLWRRQENLNQDDDEQLTIRDEIKRSVEAAKHDGGAE